MSKHYTKKERRRDDRIILFIYGLIIVAFLSVIHTLSKLRRSPNAHETKGSAYGLPPMISRISSSKAFGLELQVKRNRRRVGVEHKKSPYSSAM